MHSITSCLQSYCALTYGPPELRFAPSLPTLTPLQAADEAKAMETARYITAEEAVEAIEGHITVRLSPEL